MLLEPNLAIERRLHHVLFLDGLLCPRYCAPRALLPVRLRAAATRACHAESSRRAAAAAATAVTHLGALALPTPAAG